MGGYKTLSKRKLQALVVLEHASLGLSINDIVDKTGYGHHKVQNILAGINERAAREMSLVIQSRVALEYEKSLNLLNYCLRRCVDIDSKATRQDISLQAINTILKINDSKNQLLADSAMISRAIQKSAIVLQHKPQPTLKDTGESKGMEGSPDVAQNESPQT